jgi:hypothetical protein
MKEGFRPGLRIAGIVLGLVMGVVAAHAALAQPTKPTPNAPPKVRVPTHPIPRKPSVATDAGTAMPSTTTTVTSTAAAQPGASSPGDAGVLEAKTLDGGTRVFKFSELDIEGRLKSPQLVYFLRRVRAEFAAGDLGHRSFLREMSETRKESSF